MLDKTAHWHYACNQLASAQERLSHATNDTAERLCASAQVAQAQALQRLFESA